MVTYILLFCLIAIVILGVIRASKQKQPGALRRSKEPFVNMAQNDSALHEADDIGEPRIIRRANKSVLQMPEEEVLLFDETEEDIIVPVAKQHVAAMEAPPLFATATPKEPVVDQQHPLEVIVLHIIAHSGKPYRGYELLQAMLAVGLRYGKWDIFHRHEEPTGRGPILFSLASSVEPGTFDLAKMGSFATPGLTLFMRLAQLENPPAALEKLLAAAQQLVDELGGTVCDEQRYPLSAEKVALWQEQVLTVV